MEAFNLLTAVYNFGQDNISSGSMAVVNHLLQAFFFTTTITHIISLLLHIVHFAYAKTVS